MILHYLQNLGMGGGSVVLVTPFALRHFDAGQTTQFQVSTTSSPLPLTGWTYRLPLTIDNTANTTSALSYYQASVTLTGAAYTSFAAHAKSDGSDLRVTDSDGVTLLSFALEGIDTANSAVYLLIKVPYCAAAATKTVYVYYGNAAATSVSSYATTVGPTTALTGPTDEYTQTDSVNFNGNPLLLLLKNQGGVNGGGAGLDGKILCFLLAGANSNSDRTNGNIVMMSSTNGGSTWGGKATLVTHDSTHMAEPRSVIELADGTILLCYSTDTNTLSNTGKAQLYIAKSTNGGSTWSNLALAGTAVNRLAVPWTYGTDTGTVYGRMIEKTAGGDIYLPCYADVGNVSTGWHQWLLKCPSGSDPTNGSNWVTQGTIAFDGTIGYSEGTVLATSDQSHYVCVMRNNITTGDLYAATSTDSGATWSTPAKIGMPGTGTAGDSVSPELIKLASGNILLTWGIRYGTNWGAGAVISTDGGATWLDRAPVLFASNVGQTSGDGGYPSAVQNADGTVCIAYYREVGGNVATCNIARVVCTEDYICNANNVYDGCESFGSLWSHGANATVSTTHVHNGTNAFKIDNSAGTGGTGDWAIATLWGTNPATQGQNVAFSYWSYETANDGSGRSSVIKDSTGVFSSATGNRARIAVFTSDHIEWYNGTAFQDTSTVFAQNQWGKLTGKGHFAPTSLTGQILYNNTSLTTSWGQEASAGNPQIIDFQGGSVGSTHNVIYWVDDVYTHQYTPNTPTTATGSEQTGTTSSALPWSIDPDQTTSIVLTSDLFGIDSSQTTLLP